MSDNIKFTKEEEALIQKKVNEALTKAHQAEIEAEIRNRILDAQRGKPGYKY